MILWGGETGMVFEGNPRVADQVRGARRGGAEASHPAIEMISPQYRGGVRLTLGKYSTNTECEGVNPLFERCAGCTRPPGRFLNEADVRFQRRVIVIGAVIAGNLR